MTPKKYRLLKDLPGVPAGTIFERIELDGEIPRVVGFRNGYAAVGDDVYVRKAALSRTAVEDQKDWFEPIPDTPERPYPWEPKAGDFFDAVILDRVIQRNAEQDGHDAYASVGNVFRGRADAELRLKLEPLFNAAVKAVINRRASGGGTDDTSFILDRSGADGWVVTKGNGDWGFMHSSGSVFDVQQDAEAVVAFLRALLTQDAA